VPEGDDIVVRRKNSIFSDEEKDSPPHAEDPEDYFEKQY
jgi:hypothetical protein